MTPSRSASPGPLLAISLALAACGLPDVRPGIDAGTRPEPRGDAGDAGDDAPSDAGTTTPGAMPPVPATVARANATCSNGQLRIVDRAVDGDTVELTITRNGSRVRVRLVGVNTPETYPSDAVQCYGPESTAFTEATMAGETICLTFDPAVTAESNNVDAYGRTLGYVFFGPDFSRFLNAELVWQGYARDFAFTPGAVYANYFRTLESGAYTAGRGLWSACR